ncbi:TPA: dTDP-4-dehydrorhamnose reductase [Vibrio diabolicus]|uniref:dTDP-4-dehydrorhamnose reductase n=1 Tax=Vibrio TaxID=662 RepID=UPI001F013037|nr:MULTISPECIES: dTDP-4-dehydrorhamnose reductase [Vibrio]MCF7454666.1 dTDP-4-dehydrorhamnose reductase [Vibrio sp. A1-1]MCG6238383.1 dTDP-4-dehydrorhamnose reductase [Vibrio diabolicus]MCG9622786.1 dTDP-4-dehydrorhamnose reductase [Vibrio diabolicus]MCR9533387.1 dTDP-4-dehydrorhamnose reductase [Vibrio alginolyticus]MDW3056242.1 dTDP-4-dehydrorhamnose reductase [Vibrio sp. 1978]
MRVMIVGAKGQVGQCLSRALQNRKEVEVFEYDKELLDISDFRLVDETVREVSPNVIFNTAAYTAVDKAESEADLCYKINADGPKNLAIASERYNSLLLHISTDYVFDGDKVTPYLESDTPNPQSIYGKSKLAGEEAVRAYCKRYIILRTAWVFSEYGRNFVKTMLELTTIRNDLNIVGDQYGGPTYAGDIADALIKLMSKSDDFNEEMSGIYHFSGEPHVSWYDFANEIFARAYQEQLITALPHVSNITTAQYPTPAKRPLNSMLDCGRIFKDFSIKVSDWRSALTNLKDYKK